MGTMDIWHQHIVVAAFFFFFFFFLATGHPLPRYAWSGAKEQRARGMQVSPQCLLGDFSLSSFLQVVTKIDTGSNGQNDQYIKERYDDNRQRVTTYMPTWVEDPIW